MTTKFRLKRHLLFTGKNTIINADGGKLFVTEVRFRYCLHLLSAREDKIRIPKRPCNDLFIYLLQIHSTALQANNEMK